MNWIQRKIYLYNVTFGLYMLDWWERCLFKRDQILVGSGVLNAVRYFGACLVVVYVLQRVSLCFRAFQQANVVNGHQLG